VCLQTTTAWSSASIGPLARDQLTVPAANRVWRNDGRHPREQATAQSVPQFAEASPLAVVETQAPSTEPGLQHAILFSQERDQICLLTMKPRTHRHDEQLKRSHARSLGDRIDPVVGHYAVWSACRGTPHRIHCILDAAHSHVLASREGHVWAYRHCHRYGIVVSHFTI
jgi:hypothetical protein